MDVGLRIIRLREARSISTNRLANMAGVSQSYLREIELGRKNPTVEILSYICDALGVSLQTFFSEEENTINSFLLSALTQLNEKEQQKLADFILEIKREK